MCEKSCNVVDTIINQCQSLFTLSMGNRTNNSFFDYVYNFNCSSPKSYLVPGLPLDEEKCLQADQLSEFIVLIVVHGYMAL